jgi:hypothetical protein
MIARILLEVSAALISLGGLYDVFTPKLPPNLASICARDSRSAKLVRELLRALGGALTAVGLTFFIVIATSGANVRPLTLMLVLLLVLPSEGMNAFCMYRVGSPFQFPLAFVLLTLLGVLLAVPGLSL